MRVDQLLKTAVERNSSDIFLRAGAVPHCRVDGRIQPLDDKVITKEEIQSMTDLFLQTEQQKHQFKQSSNIDLVYAREGLGRFRINIFAQRGTPAIVARHVKDNLSSFESLNLPAELFRQFCDKPRGLILVCGPAGSGKSTTIASMIEHINKTRAKHIVTIEDPIEYLFRDDKSLVNQREIGIDVFSYPSALRYVTQQSPDVIYIGTIRDSETMQAAINAAELGVLVLSTFHTINSIQTIERIVNFFPPYMHNEVRMQLSLLLKGVVSLRLLPRKDGQGRVPAWETMVVTPTIARLIREGSLPQIQSYIDEGQIFGMQSFKQSLVNLVKQGLVEEEEARQIADSKDEFNLEMRGIKRSTY